MMDDMMVKMMDAWNGHDEWWYDGWWDGEDEWWDDADIWCVDMMGQFAHMNTP